LSIDWERLMFVWIALAVLVVVLAGFAVRWLFRERSPAEMVAARERLNSLRKRKHD